MNFSTTVESRRRSTMLLAVLACTVGWSTSGNRLPAEQPAAAEEEAQRGVLPPLDWEETILAARFRPDGADDGWVTPWRPTPFAFDELIYSWSVQLPEGEGFRLHFRVGFEDGEHSPWLYAGYWGEVALVESRRSNPRFDHGRVLLDQLLLTKPAVGYQFRVVDEGRSPLTTLPNLHVVVTDNAPAEIPPAMRLDPALASSNPLVLDLPLRRQEASDGTRMPDRCQSAAVATALEYLGLDVPTEDIEALIYDPEYRHPGIWPRIIGAATQHGLDGYITRFRDWDSVQRAIEQNHLVLASIVMPDSLDYTAPPYASIGGHIVVVNGLTDDGRVVVTDSALGRSGRGYLCQWLVEDFEKVWFDQKGGVAMIILPHVGAPRVAVEDLPPFPGDRRAASSQEE